MDQRSFLYNELCKLNIPIRDKQTDQFLLYYEMLIKKNEVMNLTSITEFQDVVQKHFVDSLMFQPQKDRGSLIDVGTGAGFPGIPLKIVYPELKITLADSLNKRLLFLQEVIEALGLEKIETVHGRAEDLGRNSLYREKFDYAVSRAVANLSTLSEYCLPFVKTGGYFISYKSVKVEEEIAAAKYAWKQLSGNMVENHHFLLPGTDMDRSLIWIRKTGTINKKYPRKAGVPSKEPLQFRETKA